MSSPARGEQAIHMESDAVAVRVNGPNDGTTAVNTSNR
jgi:hypothetical protein